MKNSSEFLPVIESSSDVGRLDEAEELAGLTEASEIMRRRDIGETAGSSTLETGTNSSAENFKLRSLRDALTSAAVQKEESFVPAVREGNTFRSRSETLGIEPKGKFRRWMQVALAGLGLLGVNKLQAADSGSVHQKPDAVVAGVPMFKAPAQANINTNVYNYEGETWKPKTPEEKEKMLKARAALEAQAASARVTAVRQEKPSGVASYGQHPQRIENSAPNNGVRPELNQNRSVNTGNYPTGNEGQFINRGGSPRPNDAVFIQGQGGMYYPEPSYPQHNNYDMRGRYSNMPSTVYYGVPPGGQIPTETRELFGKKYKAITRDAALGISGSDARGGSYPTHNESSHPKKSRSR
ncbi:MAG: hypothetical protein Q7S86_04695 [bacterium]|nr:hypothetical protein [bacterium]